MKLHRLLLAALALPLLAEAAEPLTIDVYRDPNCGCCHEWISHLRDNGFLVNDHLSRNMPQIKQQLGVPPRLASCHTGVIDGKFIEGHVPAADIQHLQADSNLKGLAVPGMPVGSPGMEMGDRHDAYAVIGLTQDGKDSVVARYPQP